MSDLTEERLFIGPFQPASDLFGSNRELYMIAFDGEHLHWYGDRVVADPEMANDFTNDDGLPVVNTDLSYVTDGFLICGHDRKADESSVYG